MKKILILLLFASVTMLSFSQDAKPSIDKFKNTSKYDTTYVGVIEVVNNKISFFDGQAAKTTVAKIVNGKYKVVLLTDKNCNLAAIQLKLRDTSFDKFESTTLHAMNENLYFGDSAKLDKAFSFITTKKSNSFEKIVRNNKIKTRCNISNWANFNDNAHKISAFILLGKLSFETTYTIYVSRLKSGEATSLLFDIENSAPLMQQGIKIN